MAKLVVFMGLHMGISSLIVLKIGLLVILGRNDGQTKLEDNISKNVEKMANNWPKIAQKWPRVAIMANLWIAITSPSYIRFGQMTPLK